MHCGRTTWAAILNTRQEEIADIKREIVEPRQRWDWGQLVYNLFVLYTYCYSSCLPSAIHGQRHQTAANRSLSERRCDRHDKHESCSGTTEAIRNKIAPHVLNDFKTNELQWWLLCSPAYRDSPNVTRIGNEQSQRKPYDTILRLRRANTTKNYYSQCLGKADRECRKI